MFGKKDHPGFKMVWLLISIYPVMLDTSSLGGSSACSHRSCITCLWRGNRMIRLASYPTFSHGMSCASHNKHEALPKYIMNSPYSVSFRLWWQRRVISRLISSFLVQRKGGGGAKEKADSPSNLGWLHDYLKRH
jgi:hypothetical protein